MTPERKQKLSRVLSSRQFDLTVVLENVFDPHNISAVMRTCDAVGIQDIFILNTRIPRHPKFGPRSSSGAAKWLTVHQFEDTEACFKAVRSRYSRVYTTHLADDAVSLYDMNLTESVALVFGNEHTGVSDEIRAIADGNFLIPQMGIISSLNISVACAVSLYEAFRQKNLAGHYNRSDLHSELKQQLLQEWSVKPRGCPF
ncbi:MAG: RNA methyltransferase [Terrimonas ferruginea]|uniref:TrmH family RNA methyltransferase n=1 Tax=Terrimonas ferruginea TaxID=249 RepID=UPI000927F200|nr:RNA methyltransferase [Terrimonas ferruginea]MBN8785291.1 RNA methyltransferase [Terrimonas ferruginea]OJW40638.1 MAG: RNA methyltransferase [Sphingobacteriales bacterium 48-107]